MLVIITKPTGNDDWFRNIGMNKIPMATLPATVNETNVLKFGNKVSHLWWHVLILRFLLPYLLGVLKSFLKGSMWHLGIQERRNPRFSAYVTARMVLVLLPKPKDESILIESAWHRHSYTTDNVR